MLSEFCAELVDMLQSGSDGIAQLARFAVQQLELVVDMTTVLLADVTHERRDATLLLQTRELDRLLQVHLCVKPEVM